MPVPLFFLNDETGADFVDELLRKSNPVEPNLVLHRLNLLEVYYDIYRDIGQESGSEMLEKVRALPIIEYPRLLTKSSSRQVG